MVYCLKHALYIIVYNHSICMLFPQGLVNLLYYTPMPNDHSVFHKSHNVSSYKVSTLQTLCLEFPNSLAGDRRIGMLK